MRSGTGAALAFAVIAASAVGVGAQQQADVRQPCVGVLIAPDDTLDSAKNHAGDAFTFQTVDAVVARDGTQIPAGTLGYGIVANSQHAGRGGQPGYLALETRFLVLGDRHVPLMIDRIRDEASAAVGSTANAPGLLGMIPLVGYAVGGYDALHHGRDAAILRGTRIAALIGDDAALGKCRALAAGESPPPTPSPSPVPSASPMPYAVPAPSASPAP